MDCVGIVVPRFGNEAIGGTETLAKHLANLLAQSFEVHIITTTIRSFGNDERYYKPGETQIAPNIKVLRFEPDHPQWYYAGSNPWEYYDIPIPDIKPGQMTEESINALRAVPVQVCERFISDHGPYSTRLQEYLIERHKQYKKVFFSPYLHATTYYGVDCVSQDQALILIAGHNEPYLFMPAYRKLVNYEQLIYTEAETDLLANARVQSLARMSFVLPPIPFQAPEGASIDYDPKTIVFSGRASYGKGFDTLAAAILSIREKGDLYNLKVLGEVDASASAVVETNKDWIKVTGPLDPGQRRAEMSKALCLVNPSLLDSFGLVNIECYEAGIPAILNENLPAFEELANHFDMLTYRDPEHLATVLEQLQRKDFRSEVVAMAVESMRNEFSNDNLLKMYKRIIEQ